MSDAAELSWKQIHRLAIEGLEASLARLIREGKGERLTREPVSLPTARGDLELWVDATRRWVDQQFYVVDADLGDGRPQDRHVVKLGRFKGKQLWLRVPRETRSALRGVPRVRVFCVSDVEIVLKRGLLAALKDGTRGPLVEQLWDAKGARPPAPSPPRERRSGRQLNVDQERAFAAMTSAGGCFVWGPPGTGKTTVITAAVADALENGRSVLIASHTHVAVDNVLEGLIEPSLPADAWSCGEVIRIASPSTQEKVSARVQEHRCLMVDKAVAELTDCAARQADLDRRRAGNRSHGDRGALAAVIADLTDVDVSGLARAQRAVQAMREIGGLRETLSALEERSRDLSERARRHRAIVEESPVREDELEGARARLRRARHARDDAGRAAQEAVVAMRKRERDRGDLEERLGRALLDVEHGAARVLPFVRERRRRRAFALEALDAEAEAAVREARELHDIRTRDRRAQGREVAEAEAEIQRLSEEHERARREAHAARELEGQADEARSERDELREALEELRRLVANAPGAEALLAEAERKGWLEKLQNRERLNERVAVLDKELEEIDREQALLRDDLARERARLLAEAPVVACTLAALTVQPALLERRFDVVILDEVASIEPAYVVYAGSRANRTLALVGDFLQNAPIAEAEDAPNEEDRALADWQKRDVFYLAGIHDRASAERHPRCVALSTQYRYPPLIAETVNAFCYDGLLESHRETTRVDGPVVTLIDTSRHPGKRLQPDGGSWWNQLGLELLVALARGRETDMGDAGFVCPYRPQALRAAALSAREELGVECGTSHRFQGREFDTVILDLMQDDRPRWAGVADLRGTERQASAAKLLNVALTRAKRHLYLIGDWEFIQRYDSPGMRALAALDGHSDFRVMDATELL
jgi:AAA domain